MSPELYELLVGPSFYPRAGASLDEGYASINGEMVPKAEAVTSVLSPSTQYGIFTFFEGERLINGKIFKGDEHNARFARSADILGVELPAWATSDRLNEIKKKVLEANGLDKDAYIRVCAFMPPTKAGLVPDNDQQGVIFVGAWEWGKYVPDPTLQISNIRQYDPRTSPVEAKGGGYVPRGMATRAAKAAGFGEALILHLPPTLELPTGSEVEVKDSDIVAEANAANFFGVHKDGHLVTPIRKGRMLDGITAQTVQYDIAQAEGIAVEQRDITVGDLRRHLRSAFITGSAAGVVGINLIDGVAEYDPNDPVTKKVVAAYEALTHG